jgi:hypothetical protein
VDVVADAAEPAETALESAVLVVAELADPAEVALESATLVFLLLIEPISSSLQVVSQERPEWRHSKTGPTSNPATRSGQ